MRLNDPTRDELLDNFHRMLTSVLGGGLHTHTGLDMETEEALWDVARAYPNASDELVAKALRAFAEQLDGTHTARRQAALEQQLARLLAEREREKPS